MTDTVHFSTLLRPYRSLSAEGFKWVMRGAIAAGGTAQKKNDGGA